MITAELKTLVGDYYQMTKYCCLGRTIGIFLAGAFTMLSMDYLWLGVFMGDFYRESLGHLMYPQGVTPDYLWPMALLVYVSMLIAICMFIISPYQPGYSIWSTALKGGFLGSLIFAVYEGTNYAFLKGWSMNVVIFDILWGFILFTVTSFVMAYVKRLMMLSISCINVSKSVGLVLIITTSAFAIFKFTNTNNYMSESTSIPHAPYLIDESESNAVSTSENKQANPENWVDLYGDYLYRFALSRLNSPELAADCVQDTFMAGIKKISTFDTSRDEKYWLRGIMRNKIIDHFRKSQRRPNVQLDEEEQAIVDSALYKYSGIASVFPEAWKFDPRKQFDRGEFREVFQECLDTVSSPAREAFVMRMIDNVDSSEVCEVLDISRDYMWVLLHRARNQLKVSLEKRWGTVV